MFYKKWKKLAFAITLMMLIFIPWDIFFTYKGIWDFNHRFIIGYEIFHLPLEEWLFFIIIPFCCVFIHEILNYYYPIKLKSCRLIKKITLMIIIILLLLSFLFFSKLYTFVCFLFTSIVLLIVLFIRDEIWLYKSLRTYFFTLFPFLIVNGFLTGSFTDAVVLYNDMEILGIRCLNIPIEDFIYNLALIMVVLLFYQPK